MWPCAGRTVFIFRFCSTSAASVRYIVAPSWTPSPQPANEEQPNRLVVGGMEKTSRERGAFGVCIMAAPHCCSLLPPTQTPFHGPTWMGYRLFARFSLSPSLDGFPSIFCFLDAVF